MGRRLTVMFLMVAMGVAAHAGGNAAADDAEPNGEPFARVGVIGLDTSHAPAFARMLNDENVAEELAGFRVVAAYPHGSADIESSVSRIPTFTEQFEEMGIAITDSIDELIDQVDVVLLTTNDGRPRLEQTLKVLRAGKPVFADKPMAASLADVLAIFIAAEQYDVPIFSSSALRYIQGADALLAGEHGEIRGVDTYGPASIEPTHPDLFWYGIHAVEPLVTLMGPDLQTVQRAHTDGQDLVVGTWADGRVGTIRGMRDMSPGFGGTAFTADGTVPLGGFGGYRPLVVDIVDMFRTGEPPVPAEQTIAVHAFMEAADESRRQDGAPVNVADVLDKAREQARDRLAEFNE